MTKGEFPQGLSISFKWMWADGRETYCDDLTVALRTAGNPRKKWSHEVEDGVTVRFSPQEGKISIAEQPVGNVIEYALGLAQLPQL